MAGRSAGPDAGADTAPGAPRIAGFDRFGADDVAEVGGKAANLGELVGAGFPVPPGFVVTTAAYHAFVADNGLIGAIVEAAGVPADDDPAAFEAAAERIHALFRAGTVDAELTDGIVRAYRALADPTGEVEDLPVAVRSSATAEDLADASFAGQQETFLNVRGPAAVTAAVLDCWASLWTARAIAYRRRQGIDPAEVGIAVVVQVMVAAAASGVLFTANPANGRRDQLVIGAAWGLGESVVGGTVGTDDLVVDRGTGAVVSRLIADKAEMTVYVEAGSGTEQRPVPASRRRSAVLDDAATAELTDLGTRIERHFGSPQDVEWALADGRVAIVQARPITALPEPSADPPTDWSVPKGSGLYFRASIVEQLPDPLTPLFADLIDPSVTRSLNALFQEAMGGADLLAPGDIGLPTVNGYAYYHYRTDTLLAMTARAPRALRSLAAKDPDHRASIGGPSGWRERSHPRYVDAVAGWSGRDPAGLAATELLDGAVALLDAGTEYYTAVQSVIPLAATSELVFRAFHDRLVRRRGEPAGLTFLLGFDSEPIRAEKSLFDLATAARAVPALAAAVSGAEPAELLAALRDGAPPAGPGTGGAGAEDLDPADWQRWRERFQQHLDRFGHAIYNLDFADPVPADEPGPLLDTVRFYLDGQGTDPYLRQRRVAEQREVQSRLVRARLDPVRRAVFDRLLAWAQDVGPVREDALADVGLAWPVIRRLLHELGARLVAAGVLADPAEVFWLREAELREVLAGDEPGPDGRPFADRIAERRMQWRGRKRAVAPQLLPPRALVNRMMAPMMPSADQNQTGPTISGVAASAGTVEAPARVLDGPADFAALRPGEVLVARITTPAWTSLFAMAAAVVTDVGGPLSHSSIVAREYGIPAVLGTGSATHRIRTGQRVRVDGDAGTVTLLDEESDGSADGATARVEHARRRRLLLAWGGIAVGVAVWRRWRRARRRSHRAG